MFKTVGVCLAQGDVIVGEILLFFSFLLYNFVLRTRGIKLMLDNNKTGNVARVNVVQTLRRGGVPVSCVAKASVKTVVNSLCTVKCSPSSVRTLLHSPSFGH